jgi:hypothetical protein
MTRSLPAARDEFIKQMNRDTGRTDRPRFLAVLDSIIEWSLARPDLLKFRVEDSRQGVVSFERVGSSVVFWSAHPTRGDAPKLELLPRAAAALAAEDRVAAMETLNAHSRVAMSEDDKLRIGFGALKNVNARTAVFGVMTQLLQVTTPVVAERA